MSFTFDSHVKVTSEKCAGVTLVINKRTEGRRIQLRLDMAPIQEKMESVLERLRSLPEPPESGDDTRTAEQKKQYAAVVAEYFRVQEDEIQPAWVKWGLVRVEGLTVDGREVTSPDEFIELAPPELYAEAVEAIKASLGLTAEQKKT